MDIRVASEVHANRACIRVMGEVDVSNADSLRSAIHEALQNEDISEIEIDLSQMPYIDSTGIGVLVGAAHRAEEVHCDFAVLDAQSNVSRIFEMLGVDEVIEIRSTVE